MGNSFATKSSHTHNRQNKTKERKVLNNKFRVWVPFLTKYYTLKDMLTDKLSSTYLLSSSSTDFKLTLKFSIDFKIALLTFRSIHIGNSEFLKSPRQPLIPSEPPLSLSMYSLAGWSRWGLEPSALCLWNSMPKCIHNIDPLHSLKSHIFKLSYPQRS